MRTRAYSFVGHGSFRCAVKPRGCLTGGLTDFLRGELSHLRFPAEVIITGFDEFTPQQRDFIEACRTAGCSVAIALREPCGRADDAVRAEFTDAKGEIEAAARWARELMEREPGWLIGIVIPDLAGSGREVARVFRCVLEPEMQLPGRAELPRLFHISAGEALAMSRLVGSALSLLSLSPRRNEWDKVSKLILNPYIAGASAERASRGLLDARVRKAGEMRPAPNIRPQAPGVACSRSSRPRMASRESCR